MLGLQATIKKIFDLPTFLSDRDAVANTFDKGILSSPRTDCPVTLPTPPSTPAMCYLENHAISDLSIEMSNMYELLAKKQARANGGQIAGWSEQTITKHMQAPKDGFEAGRARRQLIGKLFPRV